MSRRWLIIVSLSAHAALGVGIFASGIWNIERLDYRHRVSLTLGAMMPPGEAGGGEGEPQEKKEEKKTEKKEKKEKEKVVVKEPRQVDKKPDDIDPTEVALNTGGGGGEGEGEGPDVGPAIGGGGGGTCNPLTDAFQCKGPPEKKAAVCGNAMVEASEECDDGNMKSGDKCSAVCELEPVLLPPNLMNGMRTSGETQIVPPDPVKTQMLREGNERTTGSFKLCIDTNGRVFSITPIGGGTKYPTYDAKIVTAIRSWRYRPYTVNGRPMPACSVVTFVYTIK